MSQKEAALEAISGLSDECTLEDIVEHLRFLQAIEVGMEDIKAGRVIPHDEVKKEIASWLRE